MDKQSLMKLTNNYEATDSAMPEPWLQKMEELGIERRNALMFIAWSYKDKNYCGKPINLAEELFFEMAAKEFMVLHEKSGIEWSHNILNIVETMINHPEKIKITITGV